jgi:hypothetical protein
MSTQDLGQYNAAVRQNGVRLNSNEPLVAAGTTTLSGATTLSGTTTVSGALNATGGITGVTSPVVQSALVGATVVLTPAQSGGTFQNRSTSGSPSWTLPTCANGLQYTFTCAGAQVIHAKTSATGTAITTTTTLTNTQATAVVGDAITIVGDGTAWWITDQTGIFAAS